MFAFPIAAIQEQHAAGGPLYGRARSDDLDRGRLPAAAPDPAKFAYPALLGAVEARERALQEQLDTAERNRAESEALLAEHKKLLAEREDPGACPAGGGPDLC